jgi:hypothetical protein
LAAMKIVSAPAVHARHVKPMRSELITRVRMGSGSSPASTWRRAPGGMGNRCAMSERSKMCGTFIVLLFFAVDQSSGSRRSPAPMPRAFRRR